MKAEQDLRMPATARTSQARTATALGGGSVASKKANSSKTTTATPKNATFTTQTSTGKRKRNEDKSQQYSESETSTKKSKQVEEKRLKPFRKHAPKTFLEKLSRARTQRMIVVGRKRLGTGSELREDIDIVGSTGNIYKVTIARLPECTCPDHLKGNECKHKVYALHTVLKAPENLQYQRALLTAELDEIFTNAPAIPTEIGDNNNDKDGKRKPVEGECPICYMDLEEENNELVWCKAACGNNMHKSCFEQWAASQSGQAVRCVYCRSEWKMDSEDLEKIKQAGVLGEDGYVNVAEQFGISRGRDYSSYYQPWARRHFGYGW